MGMPEKVAKMRYHYHLNMLNVVNVLNQIGVVKNEKAEEIAKKHVMIALTDCAPRFTEIAHLFEEEA